MIGKTILHYRIIEQLGAGGMGVVYKAEDTKLKRTVALKFLPPDLTHDPDVKARFIQEAQAASALEHPNICNIHEINETKDGQLFIVMSCYEGYTLKEKIKDHKLEVKEAIDIAIQVAQGLAKAHSKGIIHRDIKPANIFITTDGLVKIVDFGLAKLSGHARLTKSGTTTGTPAYMSPEQAQGAEVDHRTDIWSLGVVLYEMLTGELPFKSEYEQAMIYSIINCDFNPITNYRADIPTELEILIGKALTKNPNSRYENISLFENDLILLGSDKKLDTTKNFFKKSIAYLTSLSVLIIIIIIIILLQKDTIPFSNRDWILIGDFENLTEEKVFDKSLYTAFTLSINQSRYVNVVSRHRMIEFLKRMKKPDVKYIDEDIVREMAIREGINIYLVPIISKVGQKYAIICKIQEAENGNTLKSQIQYANRENDILEKLDILSKDIRKNLGESNLEISKQNKPLKEVTTSSLEALKQYSLGIEEHWKFNLKQAKYYYENALKIDSNFTAAKASLGNLLFDKFDREQGKKLLTEAIKSIDNVTDKEKYGILAFYAVNVEGDFEKGIKYEKIRAELYPDDPTPHNNLGWYYQNFGKYDDAIAEYKSALTIDPNLMLTYSGILWIYLEILGETDSAFVWAKRMIKYDDTNEYGYCFLGSAYVGMDSLTQAERALNKAVEINPEFVFALYRLANVYRLQGEYQKAIEIFQKLLKVDEEEMPAHYNLGINYENMGDDKTAKEHFNKFRKTAEQWVKKNPNDAQSYLSLGTVLARLGDYKTSWELGKSALKLDTTSYLSIAEFMAVNGKTSLGLNYLEKAIKNGHRNYVWLRLDPDLQNLQDEPRFKKILTSK